jgi:hypothetical protein
MGKLHETLAVEGSKRNAYEKVLAETQHVFKERPDLFRAEEKKYEPFAEEDRNEAGVLDRLEMTATVKQRLEYLGGFLTDYLDTVYQKEKTNQVAVGDIVFNGNVIAAAVPVSYLLNLESTLSKLREVLHTTPTQQSGVEWVEDSAHKFSGVVKSAHAEETFKTKKILKPFELSPATKEHKAQVEKLSEDKPVGKFYRQLWSGMLSPADKSALLKRMDTLIEAVRIARMQANDIEVNTEKVATQIVAAILSD